ncbi:MAG: aldo/keto reductase [Vibrio hibernica]
MPYIANPERYTSMQYNRCGKSGLKLPAVSLGLWHNFGDINQFSNSRDLILHAFDLGITHFDLANNYGPPPGSAEENFGRILKKGLRPYRDELIISSKAGYTMWDGPYGDFGSKKYLVSSLNQSLKRMNLDYVDIFYHHRPDLDTPLEETMSALDLIVRQGKALYVGISNYPAELAQQAIEMLKEMGTPCLIHQPKFSMFERTPENGLLDVLGDNGVGCIPFSPLAGGRLTDRYLQGIPSDSRAASSSIHLNVETVEAERDKVLQLNAIAQQRGQTMAQMALAWVLHHKSVTSVLIGASKKQQITDAVKMLANQEFSVQELSQIEGILRG